MTLGRVFVDTGAWFALQVADDEHHPVARETLPDLLDASRGLVTSNLVVGETYTLLRLTKGNREARRFLDLLPLSGKLERLFVSDALEQDAYDILHRYSDHPFSFTDATSFALMRQQRLRYAFAFDAHFRIAGYLRVPIDFRLPI